MPGLHVLFLNQFFHPDLSAVAQLATDLGEDLVENGCRVTALAARGSYLGGRRLPKRAAHRGIQIVRVESTSFGKGSNFSRMADYTTFLASAFAKAAFVEKPDVILAMSTPPFVAAIAAVLQATRGIPFVYWAQDLYPELAVEFGLLRRNSLLTRTLEVASGQIVRRAAAVITLGGAMAERIIAKGAQPGDVHVVPNWADPVAIRPVKHSDNSFRDAHGLQRKKVVLYSGNMGRGHDLETVLGAAESLRHHRQDIVFLFIGNGVQRHLVERAAAKNPAILVLPYQPREMLSESLSAGDLHLVTQASKTEGLIEPSKLYGVMAAGRPVVFVGPEGTEVALTIVREGIGKVVANGDIKSAASRIVEALDCDDSAGLKARQRTEESYARKIRTRAIQNVLAEVAGARPTP